MTIKMDDNKIIVEIVDKLKPKIKKELSQTTFSNQEDLEQEMILFIVKVLKEKEFEVVDFFELLTQD
ncbi:MAG: hypothetical protein KKD36_13840 [Bacteroidetes bacterium]|nr:hypothetical protein [Bacteroidota bacterium]